MKLSKPVSAAAALVLAGALISASTAVAAPKLAAAGGARAANSAPAIDSFHPVVRESAVGLPDRTVYRPADLNHGLPVVIMSDGGCRPSNVLFVSTLMLVAARGFVVIAYGAPDSPSDIPTGTPHPERVIEAIDWLHSPAAHRQFHDQLDPDSIAVAGQSCGGLEALVAGADPRVDSVLALNSGFRPTPTGGYGRDSLTKLHTPVLYLSGGPCDVAYHNSLENYALTTVPTALVQNPQAGHATMYYGMRLDANCVPIPDDGMLTLLEQGVTMLVNWLDFTLNGNQEARQYFVGACKLCDVPGWSVDTKNGL
jgi:hypothetical protein